MRKTLDLTGQRFGKLIVLSKGQNQGNHVCWLCRCDCGTLKQVRAERLRRGASQSCGCFQRIKHRTHGACGTAEYYIYTAAKQRCQNPKNIQFPDYGGRGIEFRFECFEEFLSELGPRPGTTHSIDRIDNNGHYESGNVRWATRSEQDRNKRSNRMLTYQGKTLCAEEWAKELGFNANTLRNRLWQGWSPERALSTPVNTR